MNGNIFLLREGSNLVRMSESPYDSESLLQELLASHPDLLAGDQISPDQPRRWLLVAREMAVPGEEDGAGRWSLDHLFIDQDATPTLVEVKRSTDTRIRREVVGQMLDYAANAVVYWPAEAVRARFEKTCESKGSDPAAVLAEFLGDPGAAESFWQRVKTNLQAGRVRLVFVADLIPPELRRVVEFLNGQMDPAEVLALEVKQFVGESLKTLVPRVIGQTAEAERKKAAPAAAGKQWDEESFFTELLARRGQAETEAARAVLGWARRNGLRPWWGMGNTHGSVFLMFDYRGHNYYTAVVWTYGKVEIPFRWIIFGKPFDEEARRLEMRERFNAIPAVNLPVEGITKRPSFPLAVLTDAAALEQFLAVLDWNLSLVKNA